MKTKLVVRNGIIAIRFVEKSFSCTIIGFISHWDYKHFNEYISHKIVNLSKINKIHLKYNVIDGSLVQSLRQPSFYSLVLDKLPGFKVFSETETILHKNINKSVLNTITFFKKILITEKLILMEKR